MVKQTYLKELYNGELMKVFPKHITIEEAATLAGVSKSKLKSDFQKEYGMPFYSYFRQKRILYAAELLLQSDAKIADIAETVGYYNSCKFSKAFRSILGCSPTEYRHQNKSLQKEGKVENER